MGFAWNPNLDERVWSEKGSDGIVDLALFPFFYNLSDRLEMDGFGRS